MNKRTLMAFLVVIMLLKGSAANNDVIRVYVDGKRVDIYESTYLVDGTAYVPLREISETLGATVVIWDPNTETAEIEAPGLYLSATVGDKYIVANGRYIYAPDGVQLQFNRVMVPARALGKAFGASVMWLNSLRAVYFLRGSGSIESGDTFYSSDDVYWLSRIIYAEARGECLEGKIAVGNVVLNRVASDAFPDSVKDVIFDSSTGIQFTPAYSGAIYNTPTEECVIAAKLAIDGADVAEECLYFTSSYAADTCWAAKNREFYTQIENQVFYM